jgi:hypothetical protein
MKHMAGAPHTHSLTAQDMVDNDLAATPATLSSAGDIYLQAPPILAAAAPLIMPRAAATISATSNLFTYTGAATTVTVASAGIYDITADGAQGGIGNHFGGRGADASGDVTLTAGEVLKIIVGGEGGTGTYGGGGGGGSFVLEKGSTTTALVIGGGGGGGGYAFQGGEGEATTEGGNGTGFSAGLGGTDGHGGGSGFDNVSIGGGGGGFLSAGASDGRYTGGAKAGGAGGTGFGTANGGFGGGGGGAEPGGGGGGGYGGGGGGGTRGGGGGGGSYVEASATDTLITAGQNVGNGTITINYVGPLCYLRGTNILTPTGPAPIETLAIGDPVVTRFNGIQPIRWIGRQSYGARFLAGNPDKHPVHIRAGALGPGLPARDLFVSPGHAMLVRDRLILAACLINGITITQAAPAADLAYFQIELDSHDCIVAEGAFSETYADGPGLRAQFHNAREFHALYPNHVPVEKLTLCAPRPESGPELAAMLHPIVARARQGLSQGPLIGAIDRIAEHGEIDGWAIDTAHPDLPVSLEILRGETIIATILACDYRDDLRQAGLGRGRHAFFAKLSCAIGTGEIRIRRAGDRAELGGSVSRAA